MCKWWTWRFRGRSRKHTHSHTKELLSDHLPHCPHLLHGTLFWVCCSVLVYTVWITSSVGSFCGHEYQSQNSGIELWSLETYLKNGNLTEMFHSILKILQTKQGLWFMRVCKAKTVKKILKEKWNIYNLCSIFNVQGNHDAVLLTLCSSNTGECILDHLEPSFFISAFLSCHCDWEEPSEWLVTINTTASKRHFEKNWYTTQ